MTPLYLNTAFQFWCAWWRAYGVWRVAVLGEVRYG